MNERTVPSRGQIVQLVQRILDADGTESEIDDMIELLEKSVPHPDVCDMIFYPEEEMSAEQIVDLALAYVQPRIGVSNG